MLKKAKILGLWALNWSVAVFAIVVSFVAGVPLQSIKFILIGTSFVLKCLSVLNQMALNRVAEFVVYRLINDICEGTIIKKIRKLEKS